MSDTFKLLTLAVPNGVTTKGLLQVALCISPRIVGSGNPPMRADGAVLLGALGDLVGRLDAEQGEDPFRFLLWNQDGMENQDGITCQLDPTWRKLWFGEEPARCRERLWTQLLPWGTGYQPWAGEAAAAYTAARGRRNTEQGAREGQNTIESVGLDELNRKIQRAYGDIARQWVEPKAESEEEQRASELVENFREIARGYEYYLERLTAFGTIGAAAPPPPQPNQAATTDAERAASVPDEFHQTLSRLQEFPALLRLLGLIIDVTVDVKEKTDRTKQKLLDILIAKQSAPSASDRFHTLSTQKLTLSSGVEVESRKVAAWCPVKSRSAVAFFVPNEADLWGTNRPEDYPQPMKLRNRFALIQLDALGISFESLRAEGVSAADTGKPSLPPPLRSSGIAMTERQADRSAAASSPVEAPGLTAQLANLLNSEQTSKQTPTDDPLFAENLVRGEVVDVSVKEGGRWSEWRSLCQRQQSFGVFALTTADAAARSQPKSAPWLFSPEEFIDLPTLARKLQNPKPKDDPLSAFLYGKLSSPTQKLLFADLSKDDTAQALRAGLAETFNQVISSADLYDPQRFGGVLLSRETTDLIRQRPTGTALEQLHRRLLEDAYPREIASYLKLFVGWREDGQFVFEETANTQPSGSGWRAEEACRSLALTRAPQPLAGVVLRIVSWSNQTFGADEPLPAEVVIATPLGDWFVHCEPDPSEVQDLPRLVVGREYQFLGDLVQPGNVPNSDPHLSARRWTELGEGAVGRLSPAADPPGDLKKRARLFSIHRGDNFVESVLVFAANDSPPGSGSPAALAEVKIEFPQVLKSKTFPAADLGKSTANFSAVARGRRSWVVDNAGKVELYRPLIASLEKIESLPGSDPAKDDGTRSLLLRHLVGRSRVLAPPKTKVLLSDGTVSGLDHLPLHGQAEVLLAYEPKERRLEEIRLLDTRFQAQVAAVGVGAFRLISEHLPGGIVEVKSPGTPRLCLHLEVAAGSETLPEVMVKDWAEILDELIEGETLEVLGFRQAGQFQCVRLRRLLQRGEPRRLAWIEAVQEDEQTFLLRELHHRVQNAAQDELPPRLGQWSPIPRAEQRALNAREDERTFDSEERRRIIRFSSGLVTSLGRRPLPRLGELAWVSIGPDNSVSEFIPLTTNPVRTSRRFWGRLVRAGEDVYLATALGVIPLKPNADEGVPTGVAVRVEVSVSGNRLQAKIVKSRRFGLVHQPGNASAVRCFGLTVVQPASRTTGTVTLGELVAEGQTRDTFGPAGLVLRIDATRPGEATAAAPPASTTPGTAQLTPAVDADVTVLGFTEAGSQAGELVELPGLSLANDLKRTVRLYVPASESNAAPVQPGDVVVLWNPCEWLVVDNPASVLLRPEKLSGIVVGAFQGTGLMLRAVNFDNLREMKAARLDPEKQRNLDQMKAARLDREKQRKSAPVVPVIFDTFLPYRAARATMIFKRVRAEEYRVAAAESALPVDCKLESVDDAGARLIREFQERLQTVPPSEQVFVSEAIFTWRDWSLTAPPPFEGPADDPQPMDPRAARARALAIQSFGAAQPRTLPRLRFGAEYRLMLREMNLAGRVVAKPLDPRQLDEDGEFTLSCTYRRYDPMAAPRVIAATPDRSQAEIPCAEPKEESEAASAPVAEELAPTRVVFRSQWQKDHFEIQKTADANPRRDLFVLPPEAPLETVLGHGVLDPEHYRSPDAAYDLLAATEVRFLSALKSPTHAAPYDESDGLLPYLPDPLARRVTVAAVGVFREGITSGHAGFVCLDLAGRWPKAKAVRIVVVPIPEKDPTAPERLSVLKLECRGRNLRVLLPPGEECRLEISAAPDPDGTRLLGLEELLATPMKQAVANDVRKAAAQGLHPLVSGVQTITLIHAVNRPMEAPRIELLEQVGSRLPASPAVQMLCGARWHAPTTGRLVVIGEWDDCTDSPDRLLPVVSLEEALDCFDPLLEGMGAEEMRALLEKLRSWQLLPDAPGQPRPPVIHYLKDQMPDLLFRLHWREGTTMSEAGVAYEALVQLASRQTVSQIVHQQEVARPELGRPPKYPRLDFTHTFDDTRHRVVRYRLEAGTSFAAESAVSETVVSPPSGPVFVKATTAPRPPEIAYLMPLFGRAVEPEPGAPLTRKGNGVRIYLRRPWYSSGAGEKLAVIFAQTDTPDRLLREKVTEWGYDPVWTGPLQPEAALRPLRAADCEFAQVVPLLVPKPTPKADPWPIEAAVHPVRYSPLRGLWYCDVVLRENNGYTPFLKLALARFQKEAEESVQLSQIVSAQFIQLQPTREVKLGLTLLPAALGSRTYTVRVTGNFPQHEGDAGRRTIKAILQESEAAAPDVLDWLPAQFRHGALERLVTELELTRRNEGRDIFYEGTVTVPASRKSSQALVIQESELYETAHRETEPRTIYAERIPLAH